MITLKEHLIKQHITSTSSIKDVSDEIIDEIKEKTKSQWGDKRIYLYNHTNITVDKSDSNRIFSLPINDLKHIIGIMFYIIDKTNTTTNIINRVNLYWGNNLTFTINTTKRGLNDNPPTGWLMFNVNPITFWFEEHNTKGNNERIEDIDKIIKYFKEL